ncbi:GABBR [Mytilus coruscus]|uniref:Gamma-aminobutyric acid type B receptor subunit 2 n=1 Tax=Mytilus coruscus TaxID=42192 RepID=A0A6J8C9L6_MYTCO|nr:GABBR [Mytilus coruscus]
MQDGLWDGSGILPAAEMAIEDVNNHPDILPNYELKMVWNNSKCAHGATIRSLFHQIYSEPTKLMILGAGCSSQTSTIAETVPPWNLVQVSHASSAPGLDDRDKYPLLFKVHPSEKVTNVARAALMQKFGWKRAALLYTDDGSFNAIMGDLQKVFEQNNITVIVSDTFSDDPRHALQNIQRKDGRIIIAAAFEDNARKILCEAHKLDMTSGIFTWMFPGWYSTDWWKVNDTTCDQADIENAATGSIGFETAREFTEHYTNLTQNGNYAALEYGPYGYDSVWVVAFALDKASQALLNISKSLEDFTYDSAEIADIIFHSVDKTNITGVTGDIKFDNNGMRIGSTSIHQLQDSSTVTVMRYDDSTGELQETSSSFTWKTESGGPPSDGPLVTTKWKRLNQPLFYVLSTLATIKDWHLICGVSVLVLIDFITMTIWTAVDPQVYEKTFLDTERTGQDVFVEPYILTCSSKSYAWMGVIMAVKGLLLLFGAFIAVETRNIKMNLLNEAKEIALTIYTVLVLAGIGVPINFVVEKNIDFKYGVTSTFVILGTTVMLAACLFPKVYTVLKISVADETIMVANMRAQTVNAPVDKSTVLKIQITQLENKLKKVEDELHSYKSNGVDC